MPHEITSGGLSIRIDEHGTLRLSKGSRAIDLPSPIRLFVCGKQAKVGQPSQASAGLACSLEASERTGVLRLTPRGDALRIVARIDGAVRADTVRLEVPFAPDSTLHVATGRTYGETIGGRTPEGREAGIPCIYRPHQVEIVQARTAVASLIAHADPTRLPPDTWGPRWKLGAFAEGGLLWAAFESHAGEALEIALDESLDGTIGRHHAHLTNDYGARPWRDSAPAWLSEVRMVVTLDMLRSQGEIAHSYAHLSALCRGLEGVGLRGGILFYLPGFHGRYDSSYPIYWPAAELGGADGFREAIETVHACGHWVMPHCMTWGADPCHPFFEQIEDCAARPDPDEKLEGFLPLGPYRGWPSCMPPVPLGFDSGPVAIGGELHGLEAVIHTPEVPQPMEAILSLAGIRGMEHGRVRARLHGREVYSLPGELADGRCRLRFRLRFAPGVNLITLAFTGGAPDLSSATFRIDDAISTKPGGIWTHPIVRMDLTNPRWIAVVRDQIARLVRTFDVDAIHLDAANVRWRNEAPMHWALADALPQTLFACEYPSELGHFFFHLSQGGALPPETAHPVTDLGWRLSDPYLRSYYHLCKTPAFVPAATVCNHEPLAARLSAEEQAAAERMWSEAARWHLVPSIRLNYRDFGLDPRTRAAFAEALREN